MRLALRNFMCYRAASDGAPLELDMDGLHVVCLSGHNGSGKSALLDAITWSLWGKARIPDDDLIAQGETEMLVDLLFQLGTQQYRVVRRRQRGRTGPRGGSAVGKSLLDLQIADGAGWRPIGEGSLRETQTQIDGLLRMSYSTFVNASFLLQGRADEFTSRSTPAERKQVLAEMLDLSEYDDLERRARERARKLNDELIGMRGVIGQLELQAAQVDQWRLLLESAEARVAEATRQQQLAEVAQQSAAEAHRHLTAQAAKRRELQAQLQSLRAAQAERERLIADRRKQIATAEALLARSDTIHAGMAELAAARTELARLEQLRDQYDALSARRTELAQQFRDMRDEQQQRLSKLQQTLAQLQQAADRRGVLGETIAHAEQRLRELRPIHAEREQHLVEQTGLDAQLARIADLERRGFELRVQIDQQRNALQTALDEQQRNLRRLATQLRDASRRREQLAAANTAATELAQITTVVQALRDDERAAQAALAKAQADGERIRAALAKLQADRALLVAGDGICPICRSELGDHGIAELESHYDEESAALQAQGRAAAQAATESQAQLRTTRAAIKQQEQDLEMLRRTAAAAETLAAQLMQDERWQAEHQQAEAEAATLQARLAAADYAPAQQAESLQISTELQKLGDPDELRHRRGILGERLAELEQQVGEIQRIEGALETQYHDYETLSSELTKLPDAEAAVAAQQQILETNDFAHDIQTEGRQLKEQIEALGYSAAAVTVVRAQIEALIRWELEERELALAERDLTGFRALLARDEELQAKDAAELARLNSEDARLEIELRGLPQVEAEARNATAALEEARRQLRVADRDRAEKLANLQRAEHDAEKLAAERAREQALAARQALFGELSEALGKKGVQAMLIETAIPQIEDEANRLLSRMTDNQMHLSFEMQRDTKKGDTVETLDIRIADTLGTRTYDAFSGGEAMRANFAVRVALSRLLARRAGARLETLVIDEGFGALDALGRERMVEAITSVQNDFKRIVVITHIDDLRDRFPALIEITKTPAGAAGRSADQCGMQHANSAILSGL
ncbi:MAG: SMC family ATPase [Oscillochloris sp.]|nr:SMC family ATPase [Oscillochloris sp.]